jgi:hypothetical protein
VLLLCGCAAQTQTQSATTASPNPSSNDAVDDPAKAATAPQSSEQHVCPCKLNLQNAQIPHRCSNSQDDSCMVYPTPLAALGRVLSESPRVLAIGETHALAAHGDIKSTTTRFREELLPQLKQYRALVMETLIPAQGCNETQAQVREQTREVTEPQAKANPNEFLQLATRAKDLGITPYPLRLSCEDLKSIAVAGDLGVEQSLRLIATKTLERTQALLAEQQGPVLTYGGAMHNDLFPTPERQAWTFGPQISSISGAPSGVSYIELDLITREFIADRAPWTQLSWYPSYVRSCSDPGTLLIQQGPRSFALIFPWQTANHPPCPISS